MHIYYTKGLRVLPTEFRTKRTSLLTAHRGNTGSSHSLHRVSFCKIFTFFVLLSFAFKLPLRDDVKINM